ncbi:MAG: hypothetical protein HYZ93_04810, partial [Candidatus Omnitrophica bacterium]|nr:hypothetical protein [Candidatus Omnitrophota bacterium]
AVFADPKGTRVRGFWIPDNTVMETVNEVTAPKREVVEATNSETLDAAALPSGLTAQEVTNGDGTKSRRYTFAADDPAKGLVMEVTLGVFTDVTPQTQPTGETTGGEGTPATPMRVPQTIAVSLSGNSGLPQIGQPLADRIDLTGGLLETGRIKPINGFVGIFPHDSNLLPILQEELSGANPAPVVGGSGSLSGSAQAPVSGPMVLSSISNPQPAQSPAGPGAPIKEAVTQQQGEAFSWERLPEQVVDRIRGMLKDLMDRLKGVAAGALGVLSELKINEVVERLRGAFGRWIANCGSVALAAIVGARRMVVGLNELELVAASTIVQRLLDQGVERTIGDEAAARALGPSLTAFDLTRTARLVFNQGLQTIRAPLNSLELLLNIITQSGDRAILHAPGHWLTFLGLQRGEGGQTFARVLESDNRTYLVPLAQLLAVWRAGGGVAIVREGTAPVVVSPDRRPAGATTAVPVPATPVRVGEWEERQMAGTGPVPVLQPREVDRVDADGTASHTESFVEFQFNEAGQLIGARGGSRSWGITAFGEAFLTETVDEYIVIQELGQAKISRSTATTTTHRVDGGHAEGTTVTEFTYTDGSETAADLPAYYLNPDGTIRPEFLDASGHVKKGLTKRVVGAVGMVGDQKGTTVFGESFLVNPGALTLGPNGQVTINRVTQVYGIFGGNPKVTDSETLTVTNGIDGAVNRSTQSLHQTFDIATGLLLGASGSTHTEAADPFGFSRTVSDSAETYSIQNGQPRLVDSLTRSRTTTPAGDVTDTQSRIVNRYTDGTEDPAALPPDYSRPAPNGATPPSGRTWIGLLLGSEEGEVEYTDPDGNLKRFRGTVTLSTDAFGFNRVLSLIQNTYELFGGIPRAVLTATQTEQRGADGSRAVSVSLVRADFTDGAEDPTTLSSEYSLNQPEGKVWKSLPKGLRDQQVSFLNPLTGQMETFVGTVTVATDAFGFNTSVAKASNRYGLLRGISRVLRTDTVTANRSGDGAGSDVNSTVTYEYTQGEVADLNGDGTVSDEELAALLPGVETGSRRSYLNPATLRLWTALLAKVSSHSTTHFEDGV